MLAALKSFYDNPYIKMKMLAKYSKISQARKAEIKAAKRMARQDYEFNREYKAIQRERYQ